MKRMKIQLTSADSIVDFVNYALKVDGDVIVTKGSISIDGTSLMGMFSLDITTPIDVEFPRKATKFKKYIEQFEIK